MYINKNDYSSELTELTDLVKVALLRTTPMIRLKKDDFLCLILKKKISIVYEKIIRIKFLKLYRPNRAAIVHDRLLIRAVIF